MWLNGARVKVKTFQEYVEMYLGPKEGGAPRVYERISDRWEVCVATTEGQFNQVCGAQGVLRCAGGGTHSRGPGGAGAAGIGDGMGGCRGAAG